MSTDLDDPLRIDARTRRLLALPGVAVTLGAVPLILLDWTPRPWLIVWIVAYLCVSLFGLKNPDRFTTATVDQAWSIGVGACLSFVPISAAIWADFDAARWKVGVVVVLYVAIEAAMLPHLQLREWRAGAAIVLVAVFGSQIARGDFWTAIALQVALFALLQIGQESRDRNLNLVDLRREAEAETTRARHLARHDALTGVLNRRGITAEIETAVAGTATVVMFDADRFKSINDTSGHAVGDIVLVRIAAELNRRFGPGWKIGRLGGDEFVVVSHDALQVPDGAADPVECVITGEKHEQRLEVGLSAGAVFTTEPATADRVMAQAGYAMRDAKRRGRPIARFGGKLRRRWERGLEVSAALTGHDDGSSILPYGQLIVVEGAVVGCELLARWRRSNGAISSPSEFLPLLRDNGLVPNLNRLMLAEGVRFAARFNHQSDAPFVSVNVSASHLAAPDLVHEVRRLLAEYRVSPERLMIEITESESLWRTEWQTSAKQLREMGVLLAIDDFGAGYSSIERMASLPISHLKFDQSFATRVSSPFGEVMRGIVRFAAATGVGVIAEGIETNDQQLAMSSIGITALQGFLFSRPEPLDSLERSIIERIPAPADETSPLTY